MYTAKYTSNTLSMEKLQLKIEGEVVWEQIFSLGKIANLPELLMSPLRWFQF